MVLAVFVGTSPRAEAAKVGVDERDSVRAFWTPAPPPQARSARSVLVGVSDAATAQLDEGPQTNMVAQAWDRLRHSQEAFPAASG